MKTFRRAAIYFVGLSAVTSAIVGISVAVAAAGRPYIAAWIIAVVAVAAWWLAKIDDL